MPFSVDLIIMEMEDLTGLNTTSLSLEQNMLRMLSWKKILLKTKKRLSKLKKILLKTKKRLSKLKKSRLESLRLFNLLPLKKVTLMTTVLLSLRPLRSNKFVLMKRTTLKLLLKS